MLLKSPEHLMEGGSQTDSQSFSDSRSEPQNGQHELPCAASDVCADLAGTNDEIPRNDRHISGPAKVRQDISTKPLQDSIIHCVPVEILFIIFVFVKKAIFAPKFRGHPDGFIPAPLYKQPSQSPPLLVGAVCKRWRDVTLTIPQLWTDIIINPLKCAYGQLAMVNEWPRRSSPHPLDISVFVELRYCHSTHAKPMLDEFGDVLSVLRSLSPRWNDIALHIPQWFRYALLEDLEETPPISSFFLPYVDGDLNPIELQNPLRPSRLISSNISGMEIPFEWDRLVFLELKNADDGEILHIIRHAQNLTHCIAGEMDHFCTRRFPITTTPITNHSLIYLETCCDIIGHLTLPSLLHLNYIAVDDERFDSISQFLDRSCPPLDDFILRCYVDLMTPLPRFEMLPAITSLIFLNDSTIIHFNDDDNTVFVDETVLPTHVTDNFLNALIRSFADPILPRLKAFSFTLPQLSGPLWSLFGRLCPDRKQKNPADIEAIPSSSTNVRRPLSQVRVELTSKAEVVMDKETFLHLLEVRKSGVNLTILDYHGRSVLCDMAHVHGVELYFLVPATFPTGL